MRKITSVMSVVLSLSMMATPVYAQDTRDWTNEESFVPSLSKQEEGTLTFDFRFMQEQPVQGEHASVVLPEDYMVFENTEPVPVYAYTVETDQITDMVLGTVEVEDGERLFRALSRERMQEEPKYAEMCRRFLADTEDFSEENLSRCGIQRRFQNIVLEDCLNEIMLYIQNCL